MKDTKTCGNFYSFPMKVPTREQEKFNNFKEGLR